MPYHHLNFDAETVVTPGLTESVSAVQAAVRHLGMAAIYGLPGVGKTYGVDTACELGLGVEIHQIELASGSNQKTLAIEIAEALSPGSGKGHLRDLDQKLRKEILPGREFLLKIDEAQRLDAACFECVRRLWDDRQRARALRNETAFAVAFVGGHGCFETLYARRMLRRRISWWIHIEPLNEATTLAEIPKLHPGLLNGCARETLLRINGEYAQGVLGLWVDFLVKAADVCQMLGKSGVDDDVVEAVITARGDDRLSA